MARHRRLPAGTRASSRRTADVCQMGGFRPQSHLDRRRRSHSPDETPCHRPPARGVLARPQRRRGRAEASRRPRAHPARPVLQGHRLPAGRRGPAVGHAADHPARIRPQGQSDPHLLRVGSGHRRRPAHRPDQPRERHRDTLRPSHQGRWIHHIRLHRDRPDAGRPGSDRSMERRHPGQPDHPRFPHRRRSRPHLASLAHRRQGQRQNAHVPQKHGTATETRLHVHAIRRHGAHDRIEYENTAVTRRIRPAQTRLPSGNLRIPRGRRESAARGRQHRRDGLRRLHRIVHAARHHHQDVSARRIPTG